MDLFCFFPRTSYERLLAAPTLIFILGSCLQAQQTPILLATKTPGKEIRISADSQQMDKTTSILRGHVKVNYEQMKISADEASYDSESGEVMARGHVIFDDPKSHLVANEVHYNLITEKGWFSNSVGYLHPTSRP